MIRVAPIFQDDMILQRGRDIKIWGEAVPGEHIEVLIQRNLQCADVGADGTWAVIFPELVASEAEELIICNETEIIRIKNVAIGEVWIAAGQSNMEFQMFYDKNWDREKEIHNKKLRFYDVPKICFEGQKEVFDYSDFGIWRIAEPNSIKYFSAVGYYFEKIISEKENVPVGIIGCNFGGTRSSVWIKKESVLPQWNMRFEHDTQNLDVQKYWEAVKNIQLQTKVILLVILFGMRLCEELHL